MFYLGIHVPANRVEAAKWYRKAAEQGLARAQHRLGRCYEYSDPMGSNNDEAVKWYLKAAQQGYVEAQRDLGHIYVERLGNDF